MSLKTGAQAVEELRRRLGPPPEETAAARAGTSSATTVRDGPPFGLVDLPAGITAQQPTSWIWDTAPEVPPLRDPAAYRFAEDAGGRLHEAPHAVLGEDGAAWSETAEAYCRHSADVTMRGGTTSGVVYPAAICEIARHYRLRNVGGASAGAIAAAAAAAAELGRMGAAEGTLRADADQLSEQRRRSGHVRAGFPGLADCLAWLAQLDDGGREQFRVGQLFVPTARMRPLYRFAVAAMRGRLAFAPVLMMGAFGLFSKTVTLLGLVGAVIAVTLNRPADVAAGAWADVGAALAALAGPTMVAVGIALVFLRLPQVRPRTVAPSLREPVTRNGSDTPLLAWLAEVWALVRPMLAALAGVALVLAAATWQPLRVDLPTLAWAWCGFVLLLLVVVAASVGSVARGSKTMAYGLVSGAAPAPTRRNPVDWAAGTPKTTVDRPLVTWLSDVLNELAGLPDGEVLRFGHLWYGHQFVPGSLPVDAELRAEEPRRRRVNLELMTSELAQRRAYRFPLPHHKLLDRQDHGQLYFDYADLYSPDREVLPKSVVDAMIQGVEPISARDVGRRIRPAASPGAGSDTDGTVRLYPLPQPWDLPVVFATRLSLALPMLLQAVRLYRCFESSPVRDELGRTLHSGGTPLQYPAPDDDPRPWVEQLWFTDGGVTSNFPIHFFDSPLPRWPTFGINLGDHPPGHAHQDVWLPQDWQAKASPAVPVPGSMSGFLMSIVDTARGWSDNAQTRMPGYRGRVAWVRQRPDEGGENLFMPKAVVASLALRGALAGARLRRRFATDPMWRRHMWLRQRIAMGNLENLREALASAARHSLYRGFAADGAARLDELVASMTRYDPEPPPDQPDQPGEPDPWFRPDHPAYWDALASAFDLLTSTDGWSSLAQGPPQPAPQLRQTPPT